MTKGETELCREIGMIIVYNSVAFALPGVPVEAACRHVGAGRR